MRRILTLLTALMLSACVNDSASYYIDGANHALTVRAEQTYFWDEQVAFMVTASRWPECQRRTPLTEQPADEFDIELFADNANGWILRFGDQLWHAETQTCKVWQENAQIELGQRLGSFKIVEEKMVFVATPDSTNGAGSATPATDAQAGQAQPDDATTQGASE